MEATEIIGADWPYVLSMMPRDLEESAEERLALRRRRQVGSAGDLLRMALCYGLCDYSLRQTAAWAKLTGIGDMSDVAVLKRLRVADEWIGHLVVQWLAERGVTRGAEGLRVRVIDATGVRGPGSRGSDWRVHVGLDLAQERLASLEVTGAGEGETLLRHEVVEGEIIIADRGYGHREGVGHVLGKGGHVVVRINWQNFPLETPRGGRVDVVSSLETLTAGEVGDWPVRFKTREGYWRGRLIALRKTLAAAEREKKLILRERSRKGGKPDPRALRAAHFIYLFTDLPPQALTAPQALELYRLRWQVEIAFKRLKGLLHLDHLRAKEPALVRTYLYAKLLGALIVEEFFHRAVAFFPWGFPLPLAPGQPLAALPTVP